jgi:heterogeneous nuclear rnp K-like protein 2
MATPPPAVSSTTAAAHSQKRPLEEPNSPSTPDDQPDAKRPALDKIIKGGSENNGSTTNDGTATPSPDAILNGKSENGTKDEQGDTTLPDATPTTGLTAAASAGLPPFPETHKIQSTVSNTERGRSTNAPQDESQWIHIRAVITTTEAATVIGKGGENVTQIRKLSGAKCTISDYSRGAVERILTVSGPLDAVAKVS